MGEISSKGFEKLSIKKRGGVIQKDKKVCHIMTSNVYIYFNFGEISLQMVII